MNRMPPALRERLATDPFYRQCCVTGFMAPAVQIEWHHNAEWAGKQLQEPWCILPLFWLVHDRADNRTIKPVLDWIMLNRADEAMLKKYSKAENLVKKRERLNEKYGGAWFPGKTYFQLTPKGNIAVRRTEQQNRALHMFCSQLAGVLNDSGLDMRVVLKPTYHIPWTTTTVKEHIWRPIQKALLHKESTTELLKIEEIDFVHKVIMRELAEKHHVPYLAFPSYAPGYADTAPLRRP